MSHLWAVLEIMGWRPEIKEGMSRLDALKMYTVSTFFSVISSLWIHHLWGSFTGVGGCVGILVRELRVRTD